MWKFNWKKDKDKFLILLLAGLLLLISGMPEKQAMDISDQTDMQNSNDQEIAQVSTSRSVVAGGDMGYEEKMEKRLKDILECVEGVGKVDVMLVLRTSQEKVFLIDKRNSGTQEEDPSDGSKRLTKTWEETWETVLTGNSQEEDAVVQKEIFPEIEGIIICAQGADNTKIKAEISEAAEALFGVPPHKIKVLKRVE